MAYILSNLHMMKFYSNCTFLNSKVASNTTLFDGLPLPCANCTLMSSATFMVSDLSHNTTLGLTNECLALESKKQETTLIPSSNSNKIKLYPNLITLVFAINPPWSKYCLTLGQSLAQCLASLQLKHFTLVMSLGFFRTKPSPLFCGFFSHFL